MSSDNNNNKWTGASDSNDWNDKKNWDPSEVPTKTAEFGGEPENTSIQLSAKDNCEVQNIVFTEDAPSYTMVVEDRDIFGPPALIISGDGVRNDSNKTQSIRVESRAQSRYQPQLEFRNEASAGDSNMSYYAGPVSLDKGYGGGIIAFRDQSTAGEASFVIRTGAVPPPKENSTVGAEVVFLDNARAGRALFRIYGTLGPDGDTFGNVVFSEQATADEAIFINAGGTLSGGDGGNTQWYDYSTAGNASYYNYGGTYYKANGGDCAFDGNGTGGNGRFFNYPASAVGAYGGVTSFDNNPNRPVRPELTGTSGGNAEIHNFGAIQESDGGGGHTSFSAKYGNCKGGKASIVNYGSALSLSSSAGHTYFSVNRPTDYHSDAENATIWNQPGTSPDGAGGYTAFEVFGDLNQGDKFPKAGKATIYNLGSAIPDAKGGYTRFKNGASADHALLIAQGGVNDCQGGQIMFIGNSKGASARVQLSGNGTLDIGENNEGITLSSLDLTEGIIKMSIGKKLAGIQVKDTLSLHALITSFSLQMPSGETLEPGVQYKLLSAPNMDQLHPENFEANQLDGLTPQFEIQGQQLLVSFSKTS
jgi:hypothetical protein